jgi:adenosine deaminase
MDKSQEPYDLIANKVLAKFPQLKIKKVYHVGESSDHRNNNVEIAINAGCVRIGHGINILQHP